MSKKRADLTSRVCPLDGKWRENRIGPELAARVQRKLAELRGLPTSFVWGYLAARE